MVEKLTGHQRSGLLSNCLEAVVSNIGGRQDVLGTAVVDVVLEDRA